MSASPQPMRHVHVVSRRSETASLVRQSLDGRGYHISAAQTVTGALRQAVRPAIDVVVYCIERVTPRVLRVVENLRNRQREACLLVVGPDTGAEAAAALLRGGAFDYLTLPVTPERVHDAIRQSLETRAAFIHVRDLSATLQATTEELARERDRLKRLNGSLAMLNHIGLAVAGMSDPNAIAAQICQALAALVGVDTVGIVWMDSAAVWLESRGGLDRAAASHVRELLLARARARREDAAGSVRDGVELGPVAERPAGAGPGSVDVGTEETLEFPLRVLNECKGLLYLERRGHVWTRSEREVVRMVATSLGLALRNAEAHRRLEHLAMRDGLTDLLNRRAFEARLVQEVMATRRYRSPLCLVMADLDHFKEVNDRFGHMAGDHLLKEVGQIITHAVRSVDIVARYGGEEFAIILPRTDLMAATRLAGRIRQTIESHVFMVPTSSIRLTLSLGVAPAPADAAGSMEDLIVAADAALYEAKACGRNRVVAREWAPGAVAEICAGAPDRAPRQ